MSASQVVYGVVILVLVALAAGTVALVRRDRPPQPDLGDGPELGSGYGTALAPGRNARIIDDHLRKSGETPAE